MSEYKINEDIIGIFSKKKLIYLASLAKQVPENGWIIEIGAHSGRATYPLGMNKHDSVKLTCIDRFTKLRRKPKWRGKDDDDVVDFNNWKENTKDIKNLDWMQATLPFGAEFFAPTRKADLIVIDLLHEYEGTLQLLNDWYPYLETGGTCLVSSYTPNEGVRKAVNEFAKAESMPFHVHNGLAHIIKQ